MNVMTHSMSHLPSFNVMMPILLIIPAIYAGQDLEQHEMMEEELKQQSELEQEQEQAHGFVES